MLREIIAVIVAADSPLGREEPAIGQLTGHLPAVDSGDCPLCGPWPCAAFQKAATALHETGIHLPSLLPEPLQVRLSPPTPQPKPPPPVPRTGLRTDPWKGSTRG